MSRAYRSIAVAVLGLVLYGSVRAQQASQPSKPKPAAEFMRAVRREIAKVGFEATEKRPAFSVSFQMSETFRRMAITGHAPWRLFPPGRVFPRRSATIDQPLEPATPHAQDSLLSATDRMSEWVQERPQTAASVLRVWLEQPAAVPVAEAPREGGPP